MRKIRLDVEELVVESFDTADAKGKAGTVRGHAISQFVACVASEFSDCATCLEGCPQDTMTCFASCHMTDGNKVCKAEYC